jgi:hypothetical protein
LGLRILLGDGCRKSHVNFDSILGREIFRTYIFSVIYNLMYFHMNCLDHGSEFKVEYHDCMFVDMYIQWRVYRGPQLESATKVDVSIRSSVHTLRRTLSNNLSTYSYLDNLSFYLIQSPLLLSVVY